MTGPASEVAAAVGIWWPAADEARLREAADVWERLAGDTDAASSAGHDAAEGSTSAWSGEAASTAVQAWSRQENALADQAADARRLAAALRDYAVAVEDAKRQVEDLVAFAGGILVAGGGLLGGVGGGVAGGLAVGPIARTAAGDLSGLRAPGGRIRAALDPPNWGAEGDRFTPGVHELPGARAFQPHELPTAELLASEGKSVHARVASNSPGVKSPDALVRTSRGDPGTYTEFKSPMKPSDAAVKNEIMAAAEQLQQYGGGDLVVDGRAVGLGRDLADKALKRAIGQARAHGSAFPDRVRIVLGDGSSIDYP